ncbi:hypothetical protein ACLKA6_018057 [Drosophila palustris]
MIFGLVTVLTMRITVPTILAFDEHFYFKPTQLVVIRVYICLTALIVLEMILIHLSVGLLYMTTDWIIALYIPLLVYTIYHTYKSCVVNLAYQITDKEAKNFLMEHWNRYIEHDDPFWIQIQRRLHCCGLDGPRTYLDFLRRVHKSCYVDQTEGGLLNLRGCYDVVYDHFNGVRYIGIALSWFALFLQILVLGLYAGYLIKKHNKVRFFRIRKLRIHVT